MITVGIVDDRELDLEKVLSIIQQQEDMEIVFSSTSAKEAYEFVKEHPLDLLIADIEMPELSGYELADLIHTHALDIHVIFVTAHSGYAVHAFELNVHDYIMKPYRKERLIQSLERYREKNRSGEMKGNLFIKQKSEIHIVPKKEIQFIERTGRSSTIYTVKGPVTTYQTLNELEGELRERDFIRSHRSFIINIHYVKSFSLYAKNSYTVIFEGIQESALITKSQLDYIQNYYF
ncbi:LuxR family transcriptional regulator [Pontibacillus halophilus JSM 076056 = DSM 19796]|uniref:LuxR family transcriptional regulator n=1 Tax=Pontibacillus halophilus JSM 076056 = DSM 19796 TaxID=1385510 RepID=A0A0A5GJK7_9BACI|nr:LytTR family DNA-binding domain-containing protein [Pontibacillus halophilus]KGX91340.1 LuxR family transcriptional regulator [Pontibacillus halophilus JSM 076056 = DSM 19796]